MLKLIYGDLIPSEGMIRRHNHLKMARYHQHLHELLEMDLSPLDYMLKKFPAIKERDEMRKVSTKFSLPYDLYHKSTFLKKDAWLEFSAFTF